MSDNNFSYCKVCGRLHNISRCEPRQQPVEEKETEGPAYLDEIENAYNLGRADFQREAVEKLDKLHRGRIPADMVLVTIGEVKVAIESLPVGKGG